MCYATDTAGEIFPTPVGVNRFRPRSYLPTLHIPHTRGGEPCFDVYLPARTVKILIQRTGGQPLAPTVRPFCVLCGVLGEDPERGRSFRGRNSPGAFRPRDQGGRERVRIGQRWNGPALELDAKDGGPRLSGLACLRLEADSGMSVISMNRRPVKTPGRGTLRSILAPLSDEPLKSMILSLDTENLRSVSVLCTTWRVDLLAQSDTPTTAF